MSSDYRPQVPRLLKQLGLFLADELIPRAACTALFEELRHADGSAAEVFARPGEEIAPAMRHATERIAGASAAAIEAAIEACKARLETHFGQPLGSCEPISYVTYEAGQYYRPHVDRGSDNDARDRAISVVLFLNDAFDGGDLVFYNLLKDPRGKDAGFPLKPKTGLLVAFPSDVLHEVTPVTRGIRAVAVTWFRRA